MMCHGTSKYYPTRSVSPASAARHLGNHLAHTLRSAKVRAEETAIDIENGRQCDVGEVVAFGEYLGAQQYAGAALMNPVNDILHGVFSPGGKRKTHA